MSCGLTRARLSSATAFIVVALFLSAPGIAGAQGTTTLQLASVEINRTGMAFPDQWVITESSATLDTPQYSHSHSWTIPNVIPPGGANATVSTSATDKTGGSISALTTLFGAMDVGGGTTVGVPVVADMSAGRPTASDSKTVTVKPTSSGPAYLIVRVQDGPDVRFNFNPVATPPPSGPPPLSPSSFRPQIGVPAAYALPRPLLPLALGMPVIGPRVTAIVGQLKPARVSGPKIDDDDFIVALEPSAANLDRAARICEIMLLQAYVEPRRIIGIAYSAAACTRVVSRILQRAEELRKRRAQPSSASAAQARRCRVVAVPLRGARRGRRSPVQISCTRTAAGIQVTIRARQRGRALRSVLGSKPKLIVGRGRGTAALPGDRLNVNWTARQ